MTNKEFSEDLINLAAGSFVKDSNLFYANDKFKQTDWVCKIKYENDVFLIIYYYKGEKIATMPNWVFVLEDEDIQEFLREKALYLLRSGWRPIKRETTIIQYECPNTLEYLKD